MSPFWEFGHHIESKFTLYRGKDCIKREHTKTIIYFEKKKNVTVNKTRTKAASRCKSMLYF